MAQPRKESGFRFRSRVLVPSLLVPCLAVGLYLYLFPGSSVMLSRSSALATHRTNIRGTPQVTVKNGSYSGVYNSVYDVDYFLGVPFAQPPVNDLRLRPPQSLNASWSGIKNATEYGYACVGYGEDTQLAADNYVAEDCLTLNVYRPAGYDKSAKLPVAFWIYGGGFIEGSTIDGRYNLTFIVQRSVDMGKPILAVSINYRLSGWGFLLSKDIINAGIANLGIRDQRLALEWIQENIASFGGDPKKVTIWGESAGAVSTGMQMVAYNGRDDKLFRGAIAESGPAIGLGTMNVNFTAAEENYQSIAAEVGCNGMSDKIDCLRKVPYETLNSVLNDTNYFSAGGNLYYGPYPDGDILTDHPYNLVKQGSVVDVPYLVGDNADECTFLGIFGLNTEQELADYIRPSLPWDGAVENATALYPLGSGELALQYHPDPFNETIGLQFKRVTTLYTDVYFVGPRRISVELLLSHPTHKSPVFNYRFNTLPYNVPEPWAVSHFMEMPFLLHNLNGTGFLNTDAPYLTANPFDGAPETYYELAALMSGMWVSFIHGGDPNFDGQKAPRWPPYRLGAESQIIFDANRTSSIGYDIWRKKQISWYATILEEHHTGT